MPTLIGDMSLLFGASAAAAGAGPKPRRLRSVAAVVVVVFGFRAFAPQGCHAHQAEPRSDGPNYSFHALLRSGVADSPSNSAP